MRTNIEINDELMTKVMSATGLKTKKAVIERALDDLHYYFLIQEMEALRHSTAWSGDLDEMRTQEVSSL